MNVPQSAWRLTLCYALAAALWILFSDGLLIALGLSQPHMERLQLLKGLAFVLLTALLLYSILRAHQQQFQHTHRALQRSEQRLHQALEAAGDGIWDWDLSTHRVYFSPGYAALLGIDIATLGDTPAQWLQLMHPDDRLLFERNIQRRLSTLNTEPYEVTYRLRHEDGSYRLMQSRGRLLLNEKQSGRAPDRHRQRHDPAAQEMKTACARPPRYLMPHRKACWSRISSKKLCTATRPSPASPATAKRKSSVSRPSLLKSGRHDQSFYDSLWHALHNRGEWSGEVWNRRKSGEIYPQWQCIRVIHDEQGAVSHYVAVFSDITVLKRSQRELDYLAHHDPLSNLPRHRLLFTERVEHALERAQLDQRSGAVMLIDLDHFKHINESLGHAIGDLLLKAVGERISQQLEKGMTLARLGGDEFGFAL